MCYSGVWGTVCNDLWGRADAVVVCRQLGHSSSETTAVFSSSTFGQGSGPIILDDLQCTGLENRLIDCVHRGLGVHDCNHHQDVGIRCTVGNAFYSEHHTIIYRGKNIN